MTLKKEMENYYLRKCSSQIPRYRLIFSDELTLYLQEVQRSSGNVTETIPAEVLA
jgi:hypothetical protein